MKSEDSTQFTPHILECVQTAIMCPIHDSPELEGLIGISCSTPVSVL